MGYILPCIHDDCHLLPVLWIASGRMSDGEIHMGRIGNGSVLFGKRPVSFYALLIPFGVAYTLYYRKSLVRKWKGIAWMSALALLISAWWYIYIYTCHPELSEFVFKKESSSWVNHNVRPWYYYWKFFLENGIWALLTLLALCVPLWKKRVLDKRNYLFSLVWMLSILLFLSLVPEKKKQVSASHFDSVRLVGEPICSFIGFVKWIKKIFGDESLTVPMHCR